MISEKDMMLGNSWDWHDVVGWYASSKLWDCRAYWDGKQFWTRGGHIIDAPDWFKSGLPDCHLDGGVFIPGELNDRAATDAVNFGRFPATAKFAIYDAPNFEGNYFRRVLRAQTVVPKKGFVLKNAKFPRITKITSNRQLAEMVQEILARGGEGLVLQHPKSGYIRARTSRLLKLKFEIPEYIYA